MKNIIYSRFGKAKKPGIFYGAEGAVRFGLLVAGVPGLILLLHPIYEKEKIKAYMKEAVGWEL